MDTRHVQQPVTDFYNRLAQSIPVEDLIVFGSYLSGTAGADSDVDVVVVSEAFQGQTEDDRMRLLDQAAEGIDPVIEAWGFTASELHQAGKLTTLGYARDHGMKYSQMGK